MTSSAPVATATAAPTAAADNAQQNSFNPSWMRSAFNGAGGGASNRTPKTDYPLAAPIFVKNRYGREDMLALMGDAAGHPAPEGLQNCPFYVEEALPPIVCYPLSDLEQRLQHNINSSKAMSSLSHAERASVATGAAYGGGGNGEANTASHKSSGTWTPVKPWNRAHQAGGPPARGGSASRSHVPPVRTIPRADGGSNQESPQITPFGQRFANRGRGAPATARGGGVSGGTFNSRAQGLYDPRDPKDRPRNRVRSTSDEGDAPPAGEGGWTTAGGGKHAWGNHNKDGGQHNVWNGTQSANSTLAGSGNDERERSERKSESGPMPEWMDDGEDQEKTESSDDTTSATGSFDEHGRFQKKHYNNSIDSKAAKKSDSLNDQQHPNRSPTAAVPSGPPLPEKTAPPVQRATESNSSAQDLSKSDSEATRNYANVRQQPDSTGYMSSSAGAQMLSNPSVGVSSMSTPVLPQRTPPQFYYLDPTKQERGPFEKIQMDSWYKRGYFTEGLEVRRSTDTKYRTLGELMQLNGRITPFDYKDEVVPAPPVTAVFSNPSQSYPALFAGGSMWGELGAPASVMYGQPGYDPIAAERKRIEEEQRRILEEQAKMREYQERLMREMQKQREEHEKQLMEQKMALLKHQEEIERRERELKESAEETKARLEMERLALAEKARQIEEERAAKIKQELENARKAEEKRIEEERRKRQEEELEKQRREEEEERKRQEEAERERRAREAAEEEARRAKAAAEAAAEKLRQHAEQQKKQRAAEEQRKKAANVAPPEKEKRPENTKAFEIEETWQAAPKPTHEKKSPPTKAAPWVAAAAVPPKEKSLKEIQEEEERQLRAEQAEQARLRKEHQEAVNLQSSGTWSSASQRLQWNQPPQQTAAKAPAKPAWGGAGVEPPKANSSPFWDGPSLQAANKTQNAQPKKSAEKTVTKTNNAKSANNMLVNEKAAKRALGMAEDNSVFLEWVVQRLKQLNSSVEADVLAMFIEGVENPDEVEDYVIGYLGDSKVVKEFVREFLLKRSDFRNRKQHAVKDDLSSARGAPVSGNGSGGFSAVQGRKKKNKGARLVVDGSCLGFRATSDPNRVNQGEIETVALTPGQKK
ncbi:unnamed protein product [Cylicocyclus nassatus]|uniref:GYF domain-containing protein n=1 Tax=Cylicocyclus nassatus TaxID=53992 RepID=A0AA36HC20_CYLNA|nr:unnamed protein product [Cylicocyclus nassatus]